MERTPRTSRARLHADAPDELASFWAHALRWNVRAAVGGDIELVPTDITSRGDDFFLVVPSDVPQS